MVVSAGYNERSCDLREILDICTVLHSTTNETAHSVYSTLRTSHHKIQPFQRVSGFELMFSKNQFGQLWHDTNRKHNIWWCKVILFNFNIKKTLICLIFLIVQDSLRDQAGLPCARGTRQAHSKAFACAKLYGGAKLYFF